MSDEPVIADVDEDQDEPIRCAYAELYCRASIQGPEEWLECDNDAEEGRDYCKAHRNCEMTREDCCDV